MTEYNAKRLKQREASEHKIIEAAIRRFGQEGYAKTTIKEIAEEAGVAVGLVGKYFSTKELLLTAAYRHATSYAYPISGTDYTARECVQMLVRHSVDLFTDKPEYFQFFRTLLSASDLPQEYMDARHEFFVNSTIYPHILREQEKGSIPRKDPHKEFITFMKIVYNVVGVYALIQESGDKSVVLKTIELIINTVDESLKP